MSLRFAHDEQIVSPYSSFPNNSEMVYIGNYPSESVQRHIDNYERELRPTNQLWDAVINTGDSRKRGSGWSSSGFEAKYREYLLETDDRRWKLRVIGVMSHFRPIYVAHHPRHEEYSPARVLIEEVERLMPGQ